MNFLESMFCLFFSVLGKQIFVLVFVLELIKLFFDDNEKDVFFLIIDSKKFFLFYSVSGKFVFVLKKFFEIVRVILEEDYEMKILYIVVITSLFNEIYLKEKFFLSFESVSGKKVLVFQKFFEMVRVKLEDN